MKKVLLTLALVAFSAAAFAQGTIGFANTALTKVKLVVPGTSTVDVPTTAGLINYGVFWGTTAGSLTLVPTLGANSTANPGIIGGNASLTFAIPGAAATSTVYMQIKGWSASFGSDWQAAQVGGEWFGETDVRQVTLAPDLGPGTSIWQTASGTNPNKFMPLMLNQVVPIPEPSTFALAGLAGAALLIFRRRN